MRSTRPRTGSLVALCRVRARALVGAPHACAADAPALSWRRVWFAHAPAPWGRRLMYVPSPRGFQRSEPCRGGFFSPACWLDAGSSLGQGWCSAHSQHPSIMRMRQRCPSVEYVNIRGSTSLASASVFTAMSPPSFVRVNARGSSSLACGSVAVPSAGRRRVGILSRPCRSNPTRSA